MQHAGRADALGWAAAAVPCQPGPAAAAPGHGSPVGQHDANQSGAWLCPLCSHRAVCSCSCGVCQGGFHAQLCSGTAALHVVSHSLCCFTFIQPACLLQASALHTLAVSMLHTALAGLLLLATDPGPSPPFYLTPAQAFAALLLFDVCIPAAVAWWWRLQPAQAAAARQAGTCTAAPPVQVEAAAAASDSAGTPFARPRSRGVQRAAEPASPGAALLVAPAPESSGPGPAKHSSTTAAPDPHLLQPCTPPGLSRDSSPSPNRQQSTSPPPSPAAAHPAWDDRAPLSFEDALAACARGVAARRAAGSTAPTMLYQSKLHHHVVGIKVRTPAAVRPNLLQRCCRGCV